MGFETGVKYGAWEGLSDCLIVRGREFQRKLRRLGGWGGHRKHLLLQL